MFFSVLGASTPIMQIVRGKRFKPEMTTKKYGWLQGEGCFVFKGDVLVKQSSLKDYPGENVSNSKSFRYGIHI